MVISVNKITDKEFKKYDTLDQSLIASKDFTRVFGEPEDYIEAHVYTQNDELIYSDYNFTDYTVPVKKGINNSNLTDNIEFDAGEYLESIGYSIGTYEVEFNIFRKKIFNINEKVFFIKEISPDRTEIRLSSNVISNTDVENGTLNFIYEFQSSPYYKDFLLNFGDNKLVNAVNVALDKNTDPYSILIKLYQALPDEFQLKSSCWVVEELSESYIYEVELFPEIQQEKPVFLRGANFDIHVDTDHIKSSGYESIDDFYADAVTPSYQQIINELKKESAHINVDYSDYSNFVHFSSAKERLLNFRFKLTQIEGYNSDISSIKTILNYSSSYHVSSSVFTLQNNINGIIENFDGYETYLYFTSASTSWPKSGSLIYPTTSSQAINWLGTDDYNSNLYGGQLSTASVYDNTNQDNLEVSVPEYLFIDGQNEQYRLFLTMIGQHFDSVWIYLKAVTDIYKNENNLYTGISKDMVPHMLRSFGIHVYDSTSNDNIFKNLLGIEPDGTYITTSSYEALVTASSDIVPSRDQHLELLKRVYHNLPLLLKSKGTSKGLKDIIGTFGIPSTLLDVSEYGGSDKDSGTIEYSYDRFSYALENTGSSYFKLPWAPLSQNVIKYNIFDVVPDTVEFRFKPQKDYTLNYSSSLVTVITSGSQNASFGLNLIYNDVNDVPYGNVVFYLQGSGSYTSSSVNLPIFLTGSSGDTEWWNVMLRRRFSTLSNITSSAQYYDLFVKNEIGGRIGHQGSASIFTSASYNNNSWSDFGTTSSLKYLYLGGNDIPNLSSPAITSSFNGHLQEFRYWSAPVSESAFDIHVLNPESIQGNSSGSAYNDLAARFPLGNDLYVYNHFLTSSVGSVQPNYQLEFSSGSFIPGYYYGFGIYGQALYGTGDIDGSGTYILVTNSGSFYGFSNKINYDYYTEEYFATTPNSVYANPVTNKIRIVDNSVTGSVLSPLFNLENDPAVELTKDIHLIDISFSPQNEVNKDIIAEFGNSINIDNLIGNPGENFTDNYQDLIDLKNFYFKKYASKFNLKDYIRVASFYNNALFKFLQHSKPARSTILSGFTYKSNLLERPKIKQVNTVTENLYDYTCSIDNGYIESDSVYTSSYGDGSDFYTGELSGSFIDYKDDFEQRNENPYTTYIDDLNVYIFQHSLFNVLLNNVSSSVYSKIAKKVNNINPNILEDVELQDGNYYYLRHIRPRYLGSKSTSAKYNVYTSGDDSYGKNAAIDYNSEQFAWISEVNERNLNFFDKCSVNIKYLIDASGSATELSRQNNNLFAVQNIFKSGDTADIVLFDILNPSNQSSLDGSKVIWQGGFSYSPIIYREINEPLYFNLINPISTVVSSLGIKAIATSSVEFDTIGNTDTNFTTIPDASTLFKIDGVAQSGTSFSLFRSLYSAWPYSAYIPLNTSGPYKKFDGTTFFDPAPTLEPDSYYYVLDNFLPFESGSGGGYVTSDFDGSFTKVTTGGEKYMKFTAPRQSTYKINVSIPFKLTGTNPDPEWSTFKLVGIIEKRNGSAWDYVTKTNLKAVNIPQGTLRGIGVDETHDSIFWDADITGTNPYIEVNCILSNFSITLNQSDEIRLKVFMPEMKKFFRRTEDITFQIEPGDASKGFFEVYDAVTSVSIPITSGSVGSDPALFTLAGDYQTLIFNDSASVFYDNSFFVAPTGSVADGINLYYSPIENLFEFEQGDTIRFDSYFSANANYYYITNVYNPVVTYTGGTPNIQSSLKVKLDRQLPSGSVSAEHFAFLRKIPDETNVMMSFNKMVGKTSAGTLVPFNLSKNILDNKSNIIAPLKDSLLSKVTFIS